LRPLNPHAQLIPINASHLSALKQLTRSTLPIRYPDKFFDETITDQTSAALSRVVVYGEKPVGWIRCRLEPAPVHPSSSPRNQIYIQALCVLAPYRDCGFATHLLARVLALETINTYNVAFIYAHVWEKNEDALVWYEKRHFSRTILVDQYYRRLQPSGAWVLRMDLG
jgi:N-alpha-acetyltransferase 50